MEAMILAAGLGTRLRPRTDRLPKALLPVRGRPLLAHVMDRLVLAGATRLIINTHHHADQIREFVEQHTPAGVTILLSPEPDGPYDTGGGLLAAAPLFQRDGTFLLHNVDVLSQIPLGELLAAQRSSHVQSAATIASVAVQDRPTRRQLLFDDRGLLGWENRGSDGAVLGSERAREPVGPVRAWAFTGIHAIEPVVLDLARWAGAFSIVRWYLDLVQQGYTIRPYDASHYEWIDVGTPERLAEADALAASLRPPKRGTHP